MGNIHLKTRRACAEPSTNISVELAERMLSVDHRYGKITLSLDRNYTNAGRPMTREQIRERGGLSLD
ncbi:hypothetical protein [Paraburkholderia sp. GAS82]|uniref:hypothetical protein n=1 Tax=Paraburkholderia sp. GAS82 TaxID=3035137 RepID=UPI003D1F5663